MSNNDTKDEDDIGKILSIVKSEPEEMGTNQQEGMLGMYEDVSQRMTMETEDYVCHYSDQEYERSIKVGQDTAFQGKKILLNVVMKIIVFQIRAKFSVIFASSLFTKIQ